VVKAVQGVAENGLSFPGPTEHEIRLAEAITRRMPSLEKPALHETRAPRPR